MNKLLGEVEDLHYTCENSREIVNQALNKIKENFLSEFNKLVSQKIE